MRTILISLLLTIVIVLLYEAAIGGDGGAQQRLLDRGSRANQEIERIDP